MKILIALFISIYLFAEDYDPKEEIRQKIEYALACHARLSDISEVRISSDPVKSSQDDKIYIVTGVYKSVLSFSTRKFGIRIGDEFHPKSGTFVAKVDKDTKIKEVLWKVGIFHGKVRKSCLLNQ